MLFNPDPSKQAVEIRFSHKRDNENYSSLMFDDTKVQLATCQKHLGLVLDSKLDFNEHIDNKINKCNTFFNPVTKKLANNLQILR